MFAVNLKLRKKIDGVRYVREGLHFYNRVKYGFYWGEFGQGRVHLFQVKR